MLDALKKKLGMSPVEKGAEMQTETQQAAADAIASATEGLEAATLQVAFAEQAEKLAAVLSQVEALTAQLAEVTEAKTKLEALVAEAEAVKAAAVAAAHSMKMANRRATVEANIGTEKADAFLAATEALDDTAFNAVASALAGSVAAEAETALFNEVGVEGKVKVDAQTEEESEEMKLLRQKYKAAQPAN